MDKNYLSRFIAIIVIVLGFGIFKIGAATFEVKFPDFGKIEEIEKIKTRLVSGEEKAIRNINTSIKNINKFITSSINNINLSILTQ